MTRKDIVTEVNCDKCGKLISVQGEYIHQLNLSFVSYKIGDDVFHVENHLEPFMGCQADLCKECYPVVREQLQKTIDAEHVWYSDKE